MSRRFRNGGLVRQRRSRKIGSAQREPGPKRRHEDGLILLKRRPTAAVPTSRLRDGERTFDRPISGFSHPVGISRAPYAAVRTRQIDARALGAGDRRIQRRLILKIDLLESDNRSPTRTEQVGQKKRLNLMMVRVVVLLPEKHNIRRYDRAGEFFARSPTLTRNVEDSPNERMLSRDRRDPIS